VLLGYNTNKIRKEKNLYWNTITTNTR